MKRHTGWMAGATVFAFLAVSATAWAAAPCCGGAGEKSAATAQSEKMSAIEPAAPQAKPQTHCPVMNAPINRQLYIDHGGKRIYVCCRGCVGKVRADPEKYIRLLEERGVELERTPSET